MCRNADSNRSSPHQKKPFNIRVYGINHMSIDLFILVRWWIGRSVIEASRRRRDMTRLIGHSALSPGMKTEPLDTDAPIYLNRSAIRTPDSRVRRAAEGPN
jgi:hypothetical protein